MDINDPCYCAPAITKLLQVKSAFSADPHVEHRVAAVLLTHAHVSALARCERYCGIAPTSAASVFAKLGKIISPIAALRCSLTVAAKLMTFMPGCSFVTAPKFLHKISVTRSMRPRKILIRSPLRLGPWKLRAFKPIPMSARTVVKSKVVVNKVLTRLSAFKPKTDISTHRTAGFKTKLECVATFLGGAMRTRHCKASLKCSPRFSQNMRLSPRAISFKLEFK